MNLVPEIPESLWPIRDAAIDHVLKGSPEPELKPLYDWFEVDGWDAVTRAWTNEEMTLNLFQLAQYTFEDNEMAACEGIEVHEITDDLRLNYARDCIERGYEDEYLTPTLHSCELKRANGDSVILGCVMEIHGQGGPYLNWWGLFKNQAEFYDSIRNSGYIIDSDQDRVTDEKIMSMWKKNND